jgi:hypothetical protein
MLINNSELDHLGYYAAESYGVAYKTRGCDHTNLSVCTKVGVYGSETNSRFHNNFMGTYTWGAKGLVFTNNEYDHNVMYGLDPHDVSISLTIDHNHFDYNGDHGVICSQRCDSLTITNNESDHNGMVPFMGPTGDSDTPGQVHGIMIHRGVTNTVISGNYVHDQPNGAGIAIFDRAGDAQPRQRQLGRADQPDRSAVHGGREQCHGHGHAVGQRHPPDVGDHRDDRRGDRDPATDPRAVGQRYGDRGADRTGGGTGARVERYGGHVHGRRAHRRRHLHGYPGRDGAHAGDRRRERDGAVHRHPDEREPDGLRGNRLTTNHLGRTERC